ncbi:methyltransferase domain-containing protein [Thermoleophilia bacterium SCSIO 60948]|nr:methyltransferase domain-containing protein [Thermoleophilia bacterium SCSIO 60948]
MTGLSDAHAANRVRELALALPEATEQDHHGFPSFRVGGRIFATLRDPGRVNVMLDEDGIRTAIGDHPDLCEPVMWGEKLSAVAVDLERADTTLLADLLADAWEGKAPKRLADERAIDRMARRPFGAEAREVYGADGVHDFARRAILDALALGPGDRLIEVGCGGGLLLRDATRLGAVATGVDHSDEMVELARERAADARVERADAGDLPFEDGSFDAYAMSIVLMFVADGGRALTEARRVLAPGGRLAVYTSGPELRGTPALPEPLATRVHLREDDELEALALAAGFADCAVTDDDGAQLLTARVR